METGEHHSGPVAAHALAQASARALEPWSDRTTASHWHEGREWAVIVDWAERADGTRVPASVCLSSLGATLSDPPIPDVEPVGVTRALVDSIQWASVIADSRTSLDNLPWISGDWSGFRQYEPTPVQRAQEHLKVSTGTRHHDQMLRLVASIYLSLGGESTQGIARRVHAELVRLRAKPMRRGPEPAPDPKVPEAGTRLSEETVRRWIKEARQREYIPASRQSKSKTPKTSGHEPGDK